MRGTWSTTRCPAPTSTDGGVLRCITTRSGCRTPEHRRYDRVRLLAAVVWWVRPWWPNTLGRARDRGHAHTCPVVRPCRACEAPRTCCDVLGCPWWVETGSPGGNRLMHRDHLRTEHPERRR